MRTIAGFLVGIVAVTLLMCQTTRAQASGNLAAVCKSCHECDLPTKLNPCLKKCPRGSLITVHHAAESAPESIALRNITANIDVYEPVVFAHRSHAKMSEMSGGCGSCHHYNLTGSILSCRACHTASEASNNEDLAKPTLKGAYHRQCVNCHRESGIETKCDGSCHRAKAGTQGVPVKLVSSKLETRVARPARMTFESGYEDAKVVTFYHNDHADRFGIACTSCHVNDRCSTCHRASSAEPKPIEHLKGGHDRCSSCHSVDENCGLCHDKQPLPVFDHKRRSKFDLGRMHGALPCSRCHKHSKDFKGLSGACTSCHGQWKVGEFNHSVTGIKLDETHATLDCVSCHVKLEYAKTPSCSECHDDKSYPKALPGTRVKSTQTAKR